jgi:16S rRNA processing protein RimM
MKWKPTTPQSELPIGRIAGLFGIRGELKCDPTRSGRALFEAGATLRCVLEEPQDGGGRQIRIASVREHKGRLLVVLEGVTDATSAQRYLGATFYAPKEALDVEPGEYLDVDLAGCMLFAGDGTRLGLVERVEHYPSSDMLVVNGHLVPMVRAFIRSIDIKKREIVVHDLPEGLLKGEPL